MIIALKTYANLRQHIGKETINLELIEGGTIETALNYLLKKYGKEMENFVFGERVVILLNGKNAGFLKGLKTPLRNRDKLTILPRLSGG